MRILLAVTGMVLGAKTALAQTWTQSSAPNLNWGCVASSADGSRLVAGALDWVYCISTNSGSTWITNTEPQSQSPPYGSWSSIASSADGTTLAAINFTAIWVSTNSGAAWFSNNVPGVSFFACLALSADGKKLAVADGAQQSSPGLIYTSTNSGVTVTPTTSPAYRWTSIASSADGTKLVAAGLNLSTGGGVVYASTNSGTTWVSNGVAGSYSSWLSAASSADGAKLVVAAYAGPIYTTTNSGATWATNTTAGFNWQSVASSADGTKLVAVEAGGYIYTSTNSGATWASNNVPVAGWQSVASSADGSRLAATTSPWGFAGADNSIYTSSSTPAPSLSIATSDSNVALGWTVPSTNFVLQESADLLSWSNVTNPPVLDFDNLCYQVIISPASRNGFYRLATP